MRSVHLRLGRFASVCIPAVLFAIPIATLAADGDAKKGDEAKSASTSPAALKNDLPKIPDAVRQALQDRKYADALTAIDAALKLKDAPRDYLSYLKARALFLQQKYDDAAKAYEAVEKEFPKTAWAQRAKFGRAIAYARKGDFNSAELIYRAEAERLLSADRKQEIAELYLEFADAYFKPKDEILQKPNYAKALEFYQKALEVGPKPETRLEVELRIARCFQELANPQEAANHYQAFVKDHKDATQAIEARFRLGEVQLAMGQLEEARRTWQDLLAAHADAKSDRIPEATFDLSQTYGLPNPGSKEQLNLGVATLENFLKKYPDHKLAAPAHLRIAQSYVNAGQHADAVKAIQRFLADKRFEKSDLLPDARNLLGRAYQLQKKFPEALAAWREYLAQHPAHHDWSEVQQEILNTEYMLANEKSAEKQYDEARKLWTEFLAKYPLDPRNPRIMFLFGQMSYDQEKWDAAIADWRQLVSKYPGTNEASQGQFMIAQTIETKLDKLEDSLKEYQKVTWGGFAPRAAQSAKRLTSKTLAIRTERVFRTNETPKIKLTSRNIESVNVRAYKVDLETYFRKMHDVRGVEGLDIALIEPDKSFEFKVPKYAEYQQTESEIEIPLAEILKDTGGVMAVTVSSKTLEATTMVMQSDLDIIVKSSRDELFVFAENMRTGKAWPNVKLLLSNGQIVFSEGATGADGVLQKSFKELKDAGNVRVFAKVDSSVASNMVDLNGIGVATGLADKAFIYTDRPAYRAGQLVHVRGILRKASDDNYTIEKDKKYTVEVFDGRSRQVWQNDVKLSELGSFHVNFVLPTTAPVGSYRIVVRDDDGHSFANNFTVHEYQLDPVKLSVETDRKVFYRGEEIEGKIVAKFYYGAPLAGKEIRYQLAGGRTETATTDDKGEVKFKLPTRDFRETQALPLTVTLPERNLTIGQNFFLSTTGFSLSVSTVRPVFVSGETFEATVKAIDAENKPSEQKLVLKVLEQTVVDGKIGELEVQSHDLSTDKKDGVAKKTLKLEKGARYVLRAEATDRFQNPITGQEVVQISDDKDRVRLRILADKHTYKVGDTADVQLHWREQPALALVTFQGAKILDYKLVTLTNGANKLEIPMAAKLAPNFNLEVNVMTDTRAADVATKKSEPLPPPVRFHTAASPFTVERNLKVELITRSKGDAKAAIRPGDEVEVVIKATDPQGKPVSAELSVAMIEPSLLAMFGWNVGPIDDFFRGTTRESAMRSNSSITFAYAPSTNPIDRHLLEEEQRTEIAAEESARLKQLADSGDQLAATGAADISAMPAEAPAGTDNPFGADVPQGGALAFDVDTESKFSRFATPNEMLLEQEDAGNHAFFSQNGSGTLMLGVQVNSDAGLQPNLAGLGGFAGDNTDSGGGGGGFNRGFGGRASNSRFLQRGRELANNGPVQLRPQAQSAMRERRKFAEVDESRAGVWYNGVADESHRNWSVAQNDEKSNDIRFGNNSTVPTTQNFNSYWNEGRKDLVVVLNNGLQCNVALNGGNTLAFDAKAADAQAKQLAAAGAVLIAQTGSQETGYWNPEVVTDAKGEATLTITVPEQSTAWKLIARGITKDTLSGEAEAEIVAKKDLFGELKLPLAFTDGDDTDVIVSLHNDLVASGPINVALKTTIDGRSVEETRTVNVTKKGIEELSFKVQIRRAMGAKPAAKGTAEEKDPALDGSAVFQLTVTSGATTDTTRRSVPVHPYGVPVYAAASGTADSDTSVWVEQPADMPYEYPQLQILVGPSVKQSLLDVVFGAPLPCQLDSAQFASGIDATTSDLMACLALQKQFATAREKGGPQAEALDARIRSAIGQLVSSQQDDGGWSWTGHAGGSHRFTSARALWALSMARKSGYKLADDCFDKAKNYLNSQIATTAETDFESKAILLHALSTIGAGDFTLANRLYRNRPSLSNAALAYLVLTFIEMDRKPTAEELLKSLGERNLDEATTRRTSAIGSLPWGGSNVELRALYALALNELAPESDKTKQTIDWLMAHRTGHRWSPEKATGPATLALASWFGRARFAGEHYKLTISVNDQEAKVLEIDDNTGSVVVDVPRSMLKEGKQRVTFHLTGRGKYTYQTVLSGFVAADKMKTTTRDWQVRRYHEAAPLEVDGQEIPRGFGNLVGQFQTFRNLLSQLPVGKRGHVQLQIFRANLPGNIPDDQLEYLVVTEPLPSGVTVVENSISGGFERYELGAGNITFYIGNRRGIGDINFDVHGYLPGSYRAGPTILRDAYRPERFAVSSTKDLRVLPLGEKSGDEYRLSPVELFELGKRSFAKKNYDQAGKHFDDLLANWNVNNDTYKETARMLLDLRIETGPPAQVVRYFEIIKEKFPELEISFDKIMKVAGAYHDMNEYERSYLVFRATVESSFMRENGVAGFLESQGEFLRSVDVMNRLLAEYPQEPYVAAATFSLAQRVYEKAPQAAADQKLREKKITRVDLVQQALVMLDRFLTTYPEDPAADQAAFSLSNAMLELKQYKPVIAAATKFAERYPDSTFLDSYWYIVAYSHFALGEHEQALDMARKVAEAKRVDKQTGREVESPNKWQAVYIMGQVFHSLGKAADAIAEYLRVEDRFADARQAIEYFKRQAISLPEVTTIKPGEPADLELAFRNIAAADVKVYRIDLMKFSLLKRNLGGITKINLSGIRPLVEQDLKLGDGKDYRDRTQKLSLPLKEEGAYLVVCRGGDLYASGLVLVSPLAVEVQEETSLGRIRATIKNVLKNAYVSDVHVKAIGSRNDDFVSGETDLRGVFIGDNLAGTATVIAEADNGRYAFFRGDKELGPPPQAPNAPAAQPAAVAPPSAGKPMGGEGKSDVLLEELQRFNKDVQGKNRSTLDNNYKDQRGGVKAKEAF